MTYAQLKGRVNAALRQVKRQYRQAQTNGEKLERTLNRLVARKTLVGPQSLSVGTKQYDVYLQSVAAIQQRLIDAINIATSAG
jgi:molybdenum-dependent DNA-binding transcriptional regulator ModE